MTDFAIKVLTAKTGQTHLFSVGQAGFILKSASGQLLAIDLYLSECVERVEGNAGFKRLLPKILGAEELAFDAVICTHPHLDHFDIDTVPALLYHRNTRLFCSTDCKKLVDALLLHGYDDRIQYISPGDHADCGDFQIDFVNCDHGEGAPDAVGVVVTVDGKRIYEAGDTCLRLDRTDEIPRPLDVLIAPINGAFGNLNEADCASLAEVLQPAVTIPCHYGMFASHHGDVGRFYELMEEKRLPMRLLALGEQMTLR